MRAISEIAGVLLLGAGLLTGAACGSAGQDGLGTDARATDAEAHDFAAADAAATGLSGGDAAASKDDAGASAAPDAGSRTTTDGGRANGSLSDAGRATAGVATGRSAGCGKAAQGGGDFAKHSVRVGQHDRTYHVRLPDDYAASRAYALIFRWHGYGGDGLSGGLGIEDTAGSAAIIVAADGLRGEWSDASEAEDLALFDAIYDTLTQRYCVDLARVFSYGFSMGGSMSVLLGCEREDQLRAIAVIAGHDRGPSSCNRPVAAWFLHDRNDDAVPILEGERARDRMLARNGCSHATAAAGGGCVRYQGCDSGFPVIWCETTGLGHNIAGDTAPRQVWDFFRQLP